MEKYSVYVYIQPLYLYFRSVWNDGEKSDFPLNGGIILKQKCLQSP